jgi:four helix bundle protein
MKDKEENIVLKKSFEFASNVVGLYNKLMEVKHWDIARQVLKSGTSIGANVREAQRAVSTADFINKLGIALKEADETQYWFEIIDLKIIKIDNELKKQIDELLRLLTTIINSTKRNNKN